MRRTPRTPSTEIPRQEHTACFRENVECVVRSDHRDRRVIGSDIHVAQEEPDTVFIVIFLANPRGPHFIASKYSGGATMTAK
jgi:hypothetical protein